MKRVITSLSLLLLLLCGAYAQDISQYEYWTDDDYASRSVVSSSGGSISLDVSTASLSAGIHFLNFRAYRSDGVWGNYYRYLYYIPTLESSEVGGIVNVEYWLDDDMTELKSETAVSGNLSLAIDISALKPGVHYFNCTPISSTGERGNSERYLFYVPLSQDQTSISAIKGYEYWLDDNFASKVVSQSAGTNDLLAISIDGLTSGVHYFNCRAFNERGEYGCPVRKMFYIPQVVSATNASIASSEYWIDDDYDNKVTIEGSDSQYAFTIDISQLASGVHYFNYRARDDIGRWGGMIRQMFYIAQTESTSVGTIVEYEYWLDDDVDNKVTGTDSKQEYVFNIDVSELEIGKHTFNFKAKNVLEKWGDIFSETFALGMIPGDANGDGEVNVSDIVEIVNDIMGKTSAKFVRVAADVNEDGEVNVTDIVKVVSIIMSSANAARMKTPLQENTDNDFLVLDGNDDHTVSLALSNAGGYVASQFDVRLSGGATLEGMMQDNGRSNGHLLTYSEIGDNLYRVVIYSPENQPYVGNEGELLNIKTSGSGDVEIDNILFITEGQAEKRFSPLRTSTTGIQTVESTSESMDVYSLDGRQINTDGNLQQLPKGVYIINKKKVIVK